MKKPECEIITELKSLSRGRTPHYRNTYCTLCRKIQSLPAGICDYNEYIERGDQKRKKQIENTYDKYQLCEKGAQGVQTHLYNKDRNSSECGKGMSDVRILREGPLSEVTCHHCNKQIKST